MDTLIHLKWLVWEDQHSQNVEEWTYFKIKKATSPLQGRHVSFTLLAPSNQRLSWKLPFVQNKNRLKYLQITNLNLMELVSISFSFFKHNVFFPS